MVTEGAVKMRILRDILEELKSIKRELRAIRKGIYEINEVIDAVYVKRFKTIPTNDKNSLGYRVPINREEALERLRK